MNEKEKNNEKLISKEDMMMYKPVLVFYVKTTSWIIFPLLIAVLTGNYIEKSFSSQFLFFLLVMLGFGVTCFGIYREIRVYKKKLDKDGK